MLPSMDALIKAALDCTEICGHEQYLVWLEHEVARVKVYLAQKKRVAQIASSAEHRDIATVRPLIEACEFYGDATRYQPRKGGRPSIVAADGGRRAREALYEALDDEDDGEGHDD